MKNHFTTEVKIPFARKIERANYKNWMFIVLFLLLMLLNRIKKANTAFCLLLSSVQPFVLLLFSFYQ